MIHFLALSLALSNVNAAAAANLLTEVQVNICDSAEQLESKLNLTAWKSKKPEQSYFIENKALHFYRKDWVFKVKLSPHKNEAEVVLKKNSFINSTTLESQTEQLAVDLNLEKNEISCEYDLHGNQKKVACKLTRKISIQDFEQHRHRSDYSGLLSNDQLNWLNKEKVDLTDDLEMTSAFDDQDYVDEKKDQKVTLGITHNHKTESFIEASVRSPSDDAPEAQQQLLDYLKKRNVRLCADQTSIMTRRKLESFFSK